MKIMDHLAVTGTDLGSACAYVEQALGVAVSPGGEHALMGTHNCLLHVGDIYLEIITPNPEAEAPLYPRWFGLDRPPQTPQPGGWVCRCDDIGTAPADMGEIWSFARGDFMWDMTVSPSGQMPFEGCHPALMQWKTRHHPLDRLTDHGITLRRFDLYHPQADLLAARLSSLITDPRISVTAAPKPGFEAVFTTPWGERRLT